MEMVAAWGAAGPALAATNGVASATRSARSVSRRFIWTSSQEPQAEEERDADEGHPGCERETRSVALEHLRHPVARNDVCGNQKKQRRDGCCGDKRKGLAQGTARRNATGAPHL